MASPNTCTQTVSELLNVLREAKSVGLAQDELRSCLESEYFSCTAQKKRSQWWMTYLQFCVFSLLPILLCLTLLLFPLLALVRGSWCLVPQLVPFPEVVRPLANCSLCEGINSAPRLSNLSRYDFVHQYAYSFKPVLVVGAALEWPAIDLFSYNYFRELYHKVPEVMESEMSSGQFFSYSSNVRNLMELFSLPSDRASMLTERWYIGW